jgi:hypothetical protein
MRGRHLVVTIASFIAMVVMVTEGAPGARAENLCRKGDSQVDCDQLCRMRNCFIDGKNCIRYEMRDCKPCKLDGYRCCPLDLYGPQDAQDNPNGACTPVETLDQNQWDYPTAICSAICNAAPCEASCWELTASGIIKHASGRKVHRCPAPGS